MLDATVVVFSVVAPEERAPEKLDRPADLRGRAGDFLKFIKFPVVISFCAVLSIILDIEFESASAKVNFAPSTLV